MKENVLDVLMYLLQNAPLEDEPVIHDQGALKIMLVEAGFANGEMAGMESGENKVKQVLNNFRQAFL